MAATHGQGQGVTQPVSVQEPTEEDITSSDELIVAVDKLCAFEESSGMQRRNDLIDYMSGIVDKWVAQIAEEREVEQTRPNSRVLPFGSHVLNVVTKESDIDAVCVVPAFVRRDEFFSSFIRVLKIYAGEDLTRLRLVQGARVPIIEMCLQGFEVDLCMARLTLTQIPVDFDVNDDDILKDMELTDIWSINGVRETHRINQLIPNGDIFRAVLKAVKLWAKAQYLHNSAMGYPGGIAWSIMVAKVCQLYPNAAPSTLIVKFFKIFVEWNWPSPVIISQLDRRDVFNLKPWNPKSNSTDMYHVMPVITPAYPEKNCSFSVTRSALQITTDQLRRALNLVEKISKTQQTWDSLFMPMDFFSMYKHFLMLTGTAGSDQELLEWTGLIQARSRVFVECLEKQKFISFIHAYPKSYQQGFQTKWFWGLQFTETKGVKLILADDLRSFQEHLYDLASDRGIYKPGMELRIDHIRRKDLKSVLPEER